MQRLGRVEIWTDFVAAGGARVAIIPDRLSTITTRDVSGDDSVQLTVPRNSPVVSELLSRRVLRLLRRTDAGVESFDEWRITERTRASGNDANEFRYLARSPRADLARGDVAQVLSTGETAHVFTVDGMTPAQVIDTYVLPALSAAGLGYFARGTVNPTAPVKLTFEYFSPLAVLEALLDATMCELQVRLNGVSGYYIDILTQIGAGSTRPVFRQRRNILRNELFEQTQEQVTRCIPRGARLPGLQEYHTLARVILKVTNVAAGGGTLTLDVVDPAGAISPISYDDEFNGWRVLRQLSGVTFPIADTIKSGAQLVITSAANIAAGEYLELRPSDAQAQRVGVPRTAPNTGNASLFYFVSTDGVFPFRSYFADAGTGAVDPIVFDGQYTDLTVTFCTQIVSDNAVNIDGANGRCGFTASLATALVGDLIYYMAAGAAASPPHGASGAIASILWEITSIDTVNKYAYVKPHYANRSSEALPSVTPRRAVIIRRGNTRQIKTSNAAADYFDFTSNPSAGDLGKIVLIEQWSAGVLPSYVDDPIAVQAPPTGYGIIPRPLDKPELRGEGNLIRNPRFAAWANPVNPPDGWTLDAPPVGFAVEHSQNTAAAFLKYGAKSWNLTILDSGRSKSTTPNSPFFYVNPAGFSDLIRTAYKLSFYLTELSGDAKLGIWLRTKTATGGTIQQELFTLFAATTSAPVEDKLKFAPNQWIDLTIPAIDVVQKFGDLARASGGFELQLIGGINNPLNAGVVKLYLDSVAAYQVGYDPGLGVYVEGSYANQLLDAAHQQLASFAQPTVQYTTKIVDLSRLATDDPIVLGGELDLRDADLNQVATPRVRRIVVDEDNPVESTDLTLSTRIDRLPTIVAEGVGA